MKIKMMKKILWLVLLGFTSVVNAGVLDDGKLTSGEFGYFVRVYNNDKLTVQGGGANRIEMYDYSCLDVLQTSLPLDTSGQKGVWTIGLNDDSMLSVSGGAVDEVDFYGDSTALLTGGQIYFIASYQTVETDPHITLVCQKGWSFFEINGIVEGIDGKWLDGTDFHIEFINKNEDGCAFVYENMNIIPEPATFALFSLGGLLIKRRTSKM